MNKINRISTIFLLLVLAALPKQADGAVDKSGHGGLEKHFTCINFNQSAHLFDRGFTGHEHLDQFKIINMNARLYDPVIARFFSPDPYVQLPDNTQSYNRYSYCLNNPMSFKDPSGEIVWFVPVIVGVIAGAANVAANWDNIDGFWQGAAAFGVGAGAGVAACFTGGQSFWVVAGGSAITSGTNSVISQTGHNFSGFNNVNWGQVGTSSAIGGVAGFAGGAAGYWASNASFLVNGINSPILRSAVVSPLSAGAGHIAGGTAANLFAGQNLGDAFSNSFNGIGQSMVMGGVIGVASTAAVSLASGVNPWTGKSLNTSEVTPHPHNQFSESSIEQSVELMMSDPNKLNHIFDSKHNLEPLVQNMGGMKNVLTTTLNNANGNLPSNGIFEIPVNVSGSNIIVRGNVMNGVIRIGTMYIP